MTLHDTIKSIFGIPKNIKPTKECFEDDDNNHCWDESCNCTDDPDTQSTWSFSFGNIDDMFRHFNGDMRRQMDEMHKQFEDIFEHFGHADLPNLDEVHPFWNDSQKRSTPRDFMLREPDSPSDTIPRSKKGSSENLYGFKDTHNDPKRKVDEDVSDVKTDDIVRLFSKSKQPRDNLIKQPSTHFSKSVSVRVIRKPDGTIHEERTVCDSDGMCETTSTLHSPDGNTKDIPSQSILPTEPGENKQTEYFDKLHRFWPWWKNDVNISTKDKNITDESIYEKLFRDKK